MSVEENRRVSRRKLVRKAAVSAGAITVGGAAATLAPAVGATGQDVVPSGPGDVAVAGVIVRAEHAPSTEGGLAIGVRAAIQHPALDATGVVLVVGPVAFGRADEVNAQIAAGLRQQVGQLLAERGYPTDPETITVQLFGGAL
jgi:hypothetical protein